MFADKERVQGASLAAAMKVETRSTPGSLKREREEWGRIREGFLWLERCGVWKRAV